MRTSNLISRAEYLCSLCQEHKDHFIRTTAAQELLRAKNKDMPWVFRVDALNTLETIVKELALHPASNDEGGSQ